MKSHAEFLIAKLSVNLLQFPPRQMLFYLLFFPEKMLFNHFPFNNSDSTLLLLTFNTPTYSLLFTFDLLPSKSLLTPLS